MTGVQTCALPIYLACQRFYFKDHPDDIEVPFMEHEKGIEVYALLQGDGHTYGELKELITSGQRSLVGRLHNAGMLVIGKPVRRVQQEMIKEAL